MRIYPVCMGIALLAMTSCSKSKNGTCPTSIAGTYTDIEKEEKNLQINGDTVFIPTYYGTAGFIPDCSDHSLQLVSFTGVPTVVSSSGSFTGNTVSIDMHMQSPGHHGLPGVPPDDEYVHEIYAR